MRERINPADLVRKAQAGTPVIVEARYFIRAREAFSDFVKFLTDNRVPCEVRMYDCRVKFPSGAFVRFITEYTPHENSSFKGEVIRL